MTVMWWLKLPVIVNEASMEDVPALSELHGGAFRRMWGEEEIAALLRDEHMIALVARRSSLLSTHRPVGFVIARHVADEAEVLTIAVAPRQRRRGIARQLMENLLRRLYAERIGELFLEVDTGNIAAVALYRGLGFREVGKREGYYQGDSGERNAALVMRRDLR